MLTFSIVWSAVIWLKYCRYGVKHFPINQSGPQFESNVRNELRPFQMIKIELSTLDLISVDFISNIVI